MAINFDPYVEEYDRWFVTPKGKLLFEREVEAVRMLMKGIERPFLEIGVGTGRFAKDLGIEYGIDPSAKALEIAAGRGIRVKEAGGEALPFGNESFGAVFLLFTLCFVADPAKVFSESKRVLKSNGALIVGMMNRDSSWGELYLKKKGEGHPIYKDAHFYSFNEVTKLIREAGLKVDACASTLCQSPSETPYKEPAYDGLMDNAGFVSILCRKAV